MKNDTRHQCSQLAYDLYMYIYEVFVHMTNWREILNNSITSYDDLQKKFYLDNPELAEVINKYPLRINPYYLGLIKHADDPIWKQAVPDTMELHDHICMEDPLGEEDLSPVPNLVHKYPDRALFLVSNRCAMLCRFCTRKRKVGTPQMEITKDTIQAGLDYLSMTPSIREVLLSGGDPLLLDDNELNSILSQLRKIESIEVIRIGTRVPCTLPMRVTDTLVKILKQHHPLYINTHFNHPREITDVAAQCCNKLADGGIPLGCQTVLLKGVNDNIECLRSLFYKLLQLRVKPYYLFQADLTLGTNHFRTTTKTGIEIMRGLIGHVSGMAVPTLAIDGPGGKGKIPLTPQYIFAQGDTLQFHNFKGEVCSYPENGDVL